MYERRGKEKKKEKGGPFCVVPFGKTGVQYPSPKVLSACPSPSLLPPSGSSQSLPYAPKSCRPRIVYIRYLRIPAMALLYAGPYRVPPPLKKVKSYLRIYPSKCHRSVTRIMCRFHGQVRQLYFGGFGGFAMN